MTELRPLDLEKLVLQHGAHESPDEGMCVMEAVAFVAGEPHSDTPRCASPVIGAFLRAWNDSLSDVQRQMLRPYIYRMVGTAGSDAVEVKRAWLTRDWYVRVFTPTWLELAGLSDHAEALRTTNELIADAQLEEIQPKLSAARSAALSAAWSAARSAAGSAAWSAAGSALDPTVRRLQKSTLDLLNRMLAIR